MKYELLLVLTFTMFILLTACVTQQGAGLLDERVEHYGNLAVHTIAVSSGDETDYYPEKAIDGDYKTRWSSTFTDDSWWIVDLGYITTIDAIQIYWESPVGTSYEIQVSVDAVEWKTIHVQPKGEGDMELIEGFEVDCRFIRFFGVSRPHEWGYSFWEFEVFGEVVPAKENQFMANRDKQLENLQNLIKRLHPEPSFDNPPPFNARLAKTIPVIDGVRDDIWDSAITYPLPFNQLNNLDLTITDLSDINGSWQVLFNGTILYGIVYRTDDVTFIEHETDYENDCLELFIMQGGTMEQIRSLVGKPFDKKMYITKAAWSDDGTIFEYSVDLERELDGEIINWNIALADNDGQFRKYQMYPINGTNRSWQAVDLGELVFGKASKKQTDMQTPPFKAVPIDEVTIDANPEEWSKAVFYPLAFNQLNIEDYTIKDPRHSSAKFAIMYSGGNLYGLLYRIDDISYTAAPVNSPWDNDNFEVFLASGSSFTQARSIIGHHGFDKGFQGKSFKAVWNEDNTVFEFMLEVSETSLAGKTYGFNAALSDNDGKGRNIQLYPVNGFNDSWQGLNLGELTFVK